MNKSRLLYSILAIVFGASMFVYGGIDDSPGGQVLGLVAAIIGIVGVLKSKKKVPTQATKNISKTTCRRLTIQGYGRFTESELSALQFGIRLPYVVCSLAAAYGILWAHVPVLVILAVIAFLGVLLPYHPVDYAYNYGLRQVLNLPKLPPRPAQVKFACGIATAWLIVTLILFHYGLTVMGIIWGSMLVAVATLVSTTDICIPSIIYNRLMKRT